MYTISGRLVECLIMNINNNQADGMSALPPAEHVVYVTYQLLIS